jgi:anti-sigma B factor antagonist
VLAIKGELDLYTGPQLRDAVLAATGEGRDHVAVDLHEVTFIDSTGLGVLVACLKRVREREGALVLVAPDTSPLIRLLTLTGLQDILPTHPTLADAIR